MDKAELIEGLKRKNELGNFYNLLNSKKYDEIYHMYGKNVYNFVAPMDHKKSDVEKLISDGNYSQLYSKYGKLDRFFLKTFGKCSELKNSNLSICDPKKKKAKGIKRAIAIAALLPTIPISFIGGINLYNMSIIKHNEQVYADMLEKYNKDVEEYAEEIKSQDLTDFQIVAKVMDDTWNSIKGYGEPNYDIYGLSRLDMNQKISIGKCRNMADDFTAKLNACGINAWNLEVYQTSSAYDDKSIANIDREFFNNKSLNRAKDKYWDLTVKTNPDLTNAIGIPVPVKFSKLTDANIDPYINVKMEIRTDKELTEIVGNHQVTFVELPNEKDPLIVDITNPSVGVLRDGKIIMLTTKDGKGLEYSVFGELLYDSLENSFVYCKACLDSYSNDKSLDELSEKYDLNKALEEVRKSEHTR